MDNLQPSEEYDTEPHYIETEYLTNHSLVEAIYRCPGPKCPSYNNYISVT